MAPFIVKVQLPLVGGDVALIYNQNRSIFTEIPQTDSIRQLSKGRYKWFMWAEIQDTKLALLADRDEPKWQEW